MKELMLFLAGLGVIAVAVYAVAGPLDLRDWYKPSKWFK